MDSLKPKVGVGALIFKDGKVLAGLRKGAHGDHEYGTIGGHLEHLESFEDAIKREIREESGLEVKNLRFLCVSNIVKYAPKHYIDVSFVADWASGEPQILEPAVRESWGWYDIDNLPQPLFAFIPIYVEAYKTGKVFFDL